LLVKKVLPLFSVFCKSRKLTTMHKTTEIEGVLRKYMPEAAVPLMATWILEHHILVRITPKRKTILGTYMAPQTAQDNHTITINGDLNRYAFLITFVHEVAHLKVWLKHRNKVNPHGKEWQQIYARLLGMVINVFPNDIILALRQYMANPTAATCRDEHLYKVLKKYDKPNQEQLLLEELPDNALFKVEDGRVFQKGEKLRKFFRCTELGSNRIFRISGMLSVALVHQKV
jgi:SprT protein